MGRQNWAKGLNWWNWSQKSKYIQEVRQVAVIGCHDKSGCWASEGRNFTHRCSPTINDSSLKWYGWTRVMTWANFLRPCLSAVPSRAAAVNQTSKFPVPEPGAYILDVTCNMNQDDAKWWAAVSFGTNANASASSLNHHLIWHCIVLWVRAVSPTRLRAGRHTAPSPRPELIHGSPSLSSNLLHRSTPRKGDKLHCNVWILSGYLANHVGPEPGKVSLPQQPVLNVAIIPRTLDGALSNWPLLCNLH